MLTYNQACTVLSKMTLYGRGSVRVKPDIANVQIGVVTEARDLMVAQESNARITTQVINGLKQMGIEEKDVQTQDYSIRPEYDYIDGRQVFRGYNVQNILNVTVRNIERVGAIVDAAVANGANQVGGISFNIENPREQYRRALQMALQDAKDKAEAIAKKNHYVLCSTPISIQEEGELGIIAQEATLLKAASTTPIQPGQLEITASVKVEFWYR